MDPKASVLPTIHNSAPQRWITVNLVIFKVKSWKTEFQYEDTDIIDLLSSVELFICLPPIIVA